MTNIETIEAMKGNLKESEPTRMYSADQMDFMFKAFEVMQKIASDLMRDNSGSRNDDLIEFFLNQNFEKGMNKNDEKKI